MPDDDAKPGRPPGPDAGADLPSGRRPRAAGSGALASRFGPFELRVLEGLWRRDAAATVRELKAGFPDVAYTTLMTTLDRLFKKGVLEREPAGRAYRYRPRRSRTDLEAALAAEALGSIVSALGSRGALRPLLSTLVEAVTRSDAAALDELEALLRARRRARERGER